VESLPRSFRAPTGIELSRASATILEAGMGQPRWHSRGWSVYVSCGDDLYSTPMRLRRMVPLSCAPVELSRLSL
jgi:hypothetical protein